MKNYRKAQKMVEVSVGESVRILRELQEFSQNKLSDLTGIPQSTISAIELMIAFAWEWKGQRFLPEH